MKYSLILLIISFALISCENNYVVGGGISNPKVNKTTMKFLSSHPQLDTLAILLKRAGLANEVNDETTLFAPNDLSIKHYVNTILAEKRKTNPQATYTIDDIPKDSLKQLANYIFPTIITRDSLTKMGYIYTAINGAKRKLSLEPDQSSYSDELSSPPKYVYYIIKVGKRWDSSANNITNDKKVRVRTSNIKTENGVVMVLQGNFTLFNYNPENN